jgi:hypothetical protein
MDQGKNGVNEPTKTQDPKEDPKETAERLEEQSDKLREKLGGLVSELDHRRHQAARKYGKPAAIGSIILGVGIIAALVWRRVHRKRSTAFGVGMALGRVLPRRKQEPVKKEPSVMKKALGAAAAAAASIAARRLASSLLPEKENAKTPRRQA